METTSTKKATPVFIGIDCHKRYSVYCAEGDIVLANPCKTRIIADAQVKTDKPGSSD